MGSNHSIPLFAIEDAANSRAFDRVCPYIFRMKFVMEHIGLASQNPAALKDWYVRVLGAELVYENSQTPPGFFISLGGPTLIEIYEGETAVPQTGVNNVFGWRHLSVQVPQIEPARALLESRGVTFIDPVKPAGGGGRILFFRDSENNLLHLVERPAGSLFSR